MGYECFDLFKYSCIKLLHSIPYTSVMTAGDMKLHVPSYMVMLNQSDLMAMYQFREPEDPKTDPTLGLIEFP